MRRAFGPIVTFVLLMPAALAGCGMLPDPAIEAMDRGDEATRKKDWDLAIKEYSEKTLGEFDHSFHLCAATG